MDLTPYVEMFQEGFARGASAGDEQTKRTAAMLAGALEPAARLAIMSALSELAAEVTEKLDDWAVEVRIDGRDVRVAVNRVNTGPSAPPPPPPPDSGDISRITLRLFEQIKEQAERAAAQQGVSLNAWLSQTVQDALHGEWDQGRRGDRPDRHGRRVRGWVQG